MRGDSAGLLVDLLDDRVWIYEGSEPCVIVNAEGLPSHSPTVKTYRHVQFSFPLPEHFMHLSRALISNNQSLIMATCEEGQNSSPTQASRAVSSDAYVDRGLVMEAQGLRGQMQDLTAFGWNAWWGF